MTALGWILEKQTCMHMCCLHFISDISLACKFCVYVANFACMCFCCMHLAERFSLAHILQSGSRWHATCKAILAGADMHPAKRFSLAHILQSGYRWHATCKAILASVGMHLAERFSLAHVLQSGCRWHTSCKASFAGLCICTYIRKCAHKLGSNFAVCLTYLASVGRRSCCSS